MLPAGSSSAAPISAAPEPAPRPRRPRLPRTRARRAAYSLVAVGIVLAVGTVGFHDIAGLGYIDAFYFESMLATGQGPPLALTSDSAKLFAAVMAFVSVGSVLTSVVFTLGPLFSRIWHEAAARVEEDVRRFERELREREPGRAASPPAETPPTGPKGG